MQLELIRVTDSKSPCVVFIPGHRAFLMIFILSDKAEVAANAQQEPQYWGRC